MCANNPVYCDRMIAFVCLRITILHHHYANIYEGNELIKYLSGTFCLECVSNFKLNQVSKRGRWSTSHIALWFVELVSLSLCSLMMCANNPVYCDRMIAFVCLRITILHHHYANIYEGNELIKYLSGTFCLECVSKMKAALSVYGAVYNKLTHLSYDDCENTCTFSYNHQQMGSMAHLPLFKVGPWNNVMRGMSFHILMELSIKLSYLCAWHAYVLAYPFWRKLWALPC